jgi:hypothetical protein
MQRYLLLILYVAISLLIGKDFHPFSPFPMYNSFPNYSYVIFLKNTKGDVVPYHKNFSIEKGAGLLGHQYASFFNYHHYRSGFGEEDSVHLKEAGKELMGMLLQGEDRSKFDFDTLLLYRRYYHLNNDSINYRDDLIYEQAVKP